MSKVDPEKLTNLDRRSTILLQAAREHTETMDEKGVIGVEDPGLDALRGSFGTIGSIIRARTVRRMSQSSHRDSHLRPPGAAAPYVAGTSSWMSGDGMGLGGLKRHQLYDAPVPRADDEQSIHSQLVNKRPTIKFGEEEVVHSYSRPGIGDNSVSHEHRRAGGSALLHDGYPPLPQIPTQERQSSSPLEGNLLEMDSPDLKKSSIPRQLKDGKWNLTLPDDQSLIIPPLLTTESETRSAPPTVYAHVVKGAQGGSPASRKDLRELFDTSGGSSMVLTERATLLSFPSVTDSAPSEWNDDDRVLKAKSKESLKTDAEKSREREKVRPRTPKKYPKIEDDKEERVSLWQKEDDSDGGPGPEAGSVRLVQPGAKKF